MALVYQNTVVGGQANSRKQASALYLSAIDEVLQDVGGTFNGVGQIAQKYGERQRLSREEALRQQQQLALTADKETAYKEKQSATAFEIAKEWMALNRDDPDYAAQLKPLYMAQPGVADLLMAPATDGGDRAWQGSNQQLGAGIEDVDQRPAAGRGGASGYTSVLDAAQSTGTRRAVGSAQADLGQLGPQLAQGVSHGTVTNYGVDKDGKPAAQTTRVGNGNFLARIQAIDGLVEEQVAKAPPAAEQAIREMGTRLKEELGWTARGNDLAAKDAATARAAADAARLKASMTPRQRTFKPKTLKERQADAGLYYEAARGQEGTPEGQRLIGMGDEILSKVLHTPDGKTTAQQKETARQMHLGTGVASSAGENRQVAAEAANEEQLITLAGTGDQAKYAQLNQRLNAGQPQDPAAVQQQFQAHLQVAKQRKAKAAEFAAGLKEVAQRPDPEKLRTLAQVAQEAALKPTEARSRAHQALGPALEQAHRKTVAAAAKRDKFPEQMQQQGYSQLPNGADGRPKWPKAKAAEFARLYQEADTAYQRYSELRGAVEGFGLTEPAAAPPAPAAAPPRDED